MPGTSSRSDPVVKPGRSWRPVVFDEPTLDRLTTEILACGNPVMAAAGMGVPRRQFRKWMAEGEERVELANAEANGDQNPVGPNFQSRLYLTVRAAMLEYAKAHVGDTKAEWRLERLDGDDYSNTEHVDIDVNVGGTVAVEGRAVVGIGDVLRFLHEAGQDHALDIGPGASRRALPAARDVLPDPSGDQPAASGVPAD